VWPMGTDAAGIRDALLREVAARGGAVVTGCRVVGLEPGWQIRTEDGASWPPENVCVATGGASYPRTGSTGDGLALCRDLGSRRSDGSQPWLHCGQAKTCASWPGSPNPG